jgi:hypothetical protein
VVAAYGAAEGSRWVEPAGVDSSAVCGVGGTQPTHVMVHWVTGTHVHCLLPTDLLARFS